MASLKDLIIQEITTGGPMLVSRYMQLCLQHPQHGYYSGSDPLGREGDFTTAPEISQLFGEMIAIWLIKVWHALDRPSPVNLVELGPGRGTLMADIARTAGVAPAFKQAINVHLVESSPALRAKQTAALARHGIELTYHTRLETLPEMPTLWLANEFFDALPVNQWIRTPNGWNARKIGLEQNDKLTFGVDPTPLPPPKSLAEDPAPGTLLEHSPAQDNAITTMASYTHQWGGAGLIIDYGALRPGFGDTLQAIYKHQTISPFDKPGQSDLTTHIDFSHFARLFADQAVSTVAMAPQGAFLLAQGLLERAGQLGTGKDRHTQNAIQIAVERLAGDQAMGQLFKVFGFASQPIALPGLNQPDGPNTVQT